MTVRESRRMCRNKTKLDEEKSKIRVEGKQEILFFDASRTAQPQKRKHGKQKQRERKKKREKEWKETETCQK